MSIKNILCSLGLMVFMSVPTLAGTVEIQETVPIYTVKEGQTLTEEEQRVINDTLVYFINNPNGNFQYLLSCLNLFISAGRSTHILPFNKYILKEDNLPGNGIRISI